jgi:hypothetical protein
MPPASESAPATVLPESAVLVMRVAVSGLALGWGWWLWGRLGSQVGAWLLLHAHVPHRSIGLTERWSGIGLMVLAAVAWLPGRWSMPVALVGVLAAIDAWFAQANDGYAFAAWAVPAHALRIVAPLAFACWIWSRASSGSARDRGIRIGEWALRGATAVVFATHGLEAMAGHPRFQDLLIGTGDRLGLAWTESSVQPILWAIGLMDLGLAWLLLSGRWSRWLWWAAAWGAVTAIARVTSLGWETYGEILLRLPHVGAPLAVWLVGRARRWSAATDGVTDTIAPNRADVGQV